MSAEYNCPPICPQCRRAHRGPCQPDSHAHCAASTGSADFETERRAGHPIEYRARGMSDWQPCAVLPHMPLDKTGHWEFRLKPNNSYGK